MAVSGFERLRLGDGRWAFLLVLDGEEAGDVLAERAQMIGLFDLTRLLAETELEEFLTGGANFGGDLIGGEIADFFGSHDGRY
jgi:hypothetical protein